MKKIVAALSLAFISLAASAQQVEILYGLHVMNGEFKEFTSGELTKSTFGIAEKTSTIDGDCTLLVIQARKRYTEILL